MKARIFRNENTNENTNDKIQDLIDKYSKIMVEELEKDGYKSVRKIDVLMFMYQQKSLNLITKGNVSMMCTAQRYIHEQIDNELDEILKNIVQQKEQNGESEKQIIQELKQKKFLETVANIKLSKLCYYSSMDRRNLNNILKSKLNNFIIEKENFNNTEKNGYINFIEDYTDGLKFLAKDRWVYESENLNMKHLNKKFKSTDEYFSFLEVQNKVRNQMKNKSCSELKALSILKKQDNISELELEIINKRENTLLVEERKVER